MVLKLAVAKQLGECDHVTNIEQLLNSILDNCRIGFFLHLNQKKLILFIKVLHVLVLPSSLTKFKWLFIKYFS